MCLKASFSSSRIQKQTGWEHFLLWPACQACGSTEPRHNINSTKLSGCALTLYKHTQTKRKLLPKNLTRSQAGPIQPFKLHLKVSSAVVLSNFHMTTTTNAPGWAFPSILNLSLIQAPLSVKYKSLHLLPPEPGQHSPLAVNYPSQICSHPLQAALPTWRPLPEQRAHRAPLCTLMPLKRFKCLKSQVLKITWKQVQQKHCEWNKKATE